MRHIDRINKQYEEKEVKLLYDKAVALMNLLSDEEYEQVITDNADIFKLASHPEKGEFYLQDKHNLVQIVDIFSKFIKTKGLSKDELKNQLAQYLCSQIHNGTKDLIELIESEDLINEQWYKNWKEEMRILLQEK